MRKRRVLVVVAAVLVVGAGFGLYWFQPWKLVTSSTADEALPAPPPVTAGATAPAPASAPPAQPVVLKHGTFITHEHDTSGSARIVRLADGSHALEITDLDTSNGPDLRVWLTDREVKPGTAGWRVFDDGTWVELGKLRANKGNLVYPIPAEVDLAQYRSVSIWCRRFAVSFGAAALS